MRLLLLADLHIGSIKDTDYYYRNMNKIISDEIIMTHTDAVILLGDYFDRLFKVNEEYVSLAINVMSALIRACKRQKTKIRIIYGTESHEMNQYRLFNYHFTSSHVDVKLFTTVAEEELFPGVNVLYIPEEYIDDKYEFYKNTLYSGKKYDYIFGHGIIEEGMGIGAKVKSASDKMEKQVPRFKAGELAEAGKLNVWGHYHRHVDLDGNVHYVGSLFRKSFGEEEAKGYAVIEDGEWKFIPNENAYIYKTYEFDETSDVFSSPDKLMKTINEIKEQNEGIFSGDTVGKIRVVFHAPEGTDQAFFEALKTVTTSDNLITPLVKEVEHTVIEEDNSVSDEFSFVLDNNMSIPDKIHSFLNTRRWNDEGTIPEEVQNLTSEVIEKYINSPLEI